MMKRKFEDSPASSLPSPTSTKDRLKMRKRRKLNRMFERQCKKEEVPFPSLNPREQEHILSCASCQELWPLYVFRATHIQKHDVEKIHQDWSLIPESDRQFLRKELLKEDKKWIEREANKRPHTAYQLFLKDEMELRKPLPENGFKEANRQISEKWKIVTPKLKQHYEGLSYQAKQQHKNILANLPKYKRKLIDQARKKQKLAKRIIPDKKPRTPYIRYLQARKKEEEAKGINHKYPELMKLAGLEWRSLSEDKKKPYLEAYEKERDSWQKKKQKALEKQKLLKEQQCKKVSVSQTDALSQKTTK